MPMKCYICGYPAIAQDVCYDHAVLCERCGTQPCSPRIHFCTNCFVSDGLDSLISCVCVLSYLSAIVVANWAVSVYGQKALPFTALILIPFDLMARDVLHERWRGRGLWFKMFILIITGSLLSYFSSLASANVSIASAVSFLVTGIVDTVSYQLLDKQSKTTKMNLSNLCSAVTDSLLFPMIAFGSVNFALSGLQAFSKFAGGLCWVSIYLIVTNRIHKGTTEDNDVDYTDDYS